MVGKQNLTIQHRNPSRVGYVFSICHEKVE